MNVRIKKSNSDPVNYKGEYHYRSGSTKQQLKGQALNQFLLQKPELPGTVCQCRM